MICKWTKFDNPNELIWLEPSSFAAGLKSFGGTVMCIFLEPLVLFLIRSTFSKS